MGRIKERAFKYRGWWVEKTAGSPFWYGHKRVPGKRGARRFSLKTEDFEEACQTLRAWVLEHEELPLEDPKKVPLSRVLERYYFRHAQHLPSAGQAVIASNHLIDFYGEDCMVAALTLQRQHLYFEHRRQAGVSNETINREQSVVQAALRQAVKFGELSNVPVIDMLKRSPPRDKLLELDEIAALHDGFDCAYGQAFLWLAVGTAARKQAILDLTGANCDIERRLIDLNPRGRSQTHKRRPIVPLVDSLVPIVQAAGEGHIVNLNGTALQDIKSAWRRARKAAKLSPDVNPHAIRRTVAAELRRRDVPEHECAGLLGHRWSNSTTERYAHHRPEFMVRASAAIDAMIKEIARRTAIQRATIGV